MKYEFFITKQISQYFHIFHIIIFFFFLFYYQTRYLTWLHFNTSFFQTILQLQINQQIEIIKEYKLLKHEIHFPFVVLSGVGQEDDNRLLLTDNRFLSFPSLWLMCFFLSSRMDTDLLL